MNAAANAAVNAVNPAAKPAEANIEPPEVEPGRARAGLEEWLAEVEYAPSALAEAARVLADEVDRDRASSPLWGRYQHALGQLVEYVDAVREEERRRGERFLADLEHAGDVEEFRVSRYRQAVEAGEDASRWSRLVPAACVEGDHRWHQWPEGGRVCLDCDRPAS